MTDVDFYFPDQKELVRQCFHLYATNPIGALKEYVSNSVDGRRDGSSATVDILINRNQEEVIISDNGKGMTYTKLSSLPQSLGLSENRGDRDTRGEKALGLLAFGGFGDRVDIISRAEGSDQYSILHMDKKRCKATVSPLSSEQLKRYGGEFAHGTRTIVYGVTKKTISNYFTPSRLHQELQMMYDPLLRRGDLGIRVAYMERRNHMSEIQEKQRTGTLTLNEIITTPCRIKQGESYMDSTGQVDFFLFSNPDGTTDKVALYNKGVLVLPSITRLREFNHHPWTSNQLAGSIDENFCELIPQREGYMRDDNFDTLCELLLSKESDISEKVKAAEKAHKGRQLRSTINKLNDALKGAYRHSPSPWDRPNGNGNGTGNGRGSGGRRKPRDPNGEQTICPPPSRRGGNGCGTGASRSGYPIQVVEFGLDKSHLRSTFDYDMSQAIQLNKTHPDFEYHAEQNNEDSWIYFGKLVSKEAAVADFLLSREGVDQIATADIPDITERSASLFFEMMNLFGVMKKAE